MRVVVLLVPLAATACLPSFDALECLNGCPTGKSCNKFFTACEPSIKLSRSELHLGHGRSVELRVCQQSTLATWRAIPTPSSTVAPTSPVLTATTSSASVSFVVTPTSALSSDFVVEALPLESGLGLEHASLHVSADSFPTPLVTVAQGGGAIQTLAVLGHFVVVQRQNQPLPAIVPLDIGTRTSTLPIELSTSSIAINLRPSMQIGSIVASSSVAYLSYHLGGQLRSGATQVFELVPDFAHPELSTMTEIMGHRCDATILATFADPSGKLYYIDLNHKLYPFGAASELLSLSLIASSYAVAVRDWTVYYAGVGAGATGEIHSIDLKSATDTPLMTADGNVQALAVDRTGTHLYAALISAADDTIQRIDLSNGTTETAATLTSTPLQGGMGLLPPDDSIGDLVVSGADLERIQLAAQYVDEGSRVVPTACPP
jgi:hypothetical protein